YAMFVDSTHEGDKLLWILTASLQQSRRVLNEQHWLVPPQRLQRALQHLAIIALNIYLDDIYATDSTVGHECVNTPHRDRHRPALAYACFRRGSLGRRVGSNLPVGQEDFKLAVCLSHSHFLHRDPVRNPIELQILAQERYVLGHRLKSIDNAGGADSLRGND